MKRGQYICIDIGGTAIKYGLLDAAGHILESQRMHTEVWKGGRGIMEKTKTIVAMYQDRADGICISSSGMVDCDKGEIFYSGPTIPDYIGVNFKQELGEEFHLPVEIENDVNCAGLAEAISGVAKDASIVMCLTVGTGVGGCLVQNKEVYHGYSGSAMEVGYMRIFDSPRNFQEQGAASVLAARVSELKSAQPHAGKGRWNCPRIFEAAKAGDLDCIASIDELARVLGYGIAAMCYMLNPEMIVLGGGIMGQSEFLLPRIRREMERNLLPVIAEKTALKAAFYQNEAGMVGAFYHFRKRHPELFKEEI